MSLQGKQWGKTKRLLQTPVCEIHQITAREGGYCSEHVHQSKYNWFYVISGMLRVRTWQAKGIVDVTELEATQSCIVPPGRRHQFEAISGTVALEAYWAQLDGEDIRRYSIGGINGKSV